MLQKWVSLNSLRNCKEKVKKKRSSKKKQVSTSDSDKKNSAETEEKSLSDDDSNLLQESSDENKDLKAVIKVLPIPTLNLKQNWNQL